MKEHCPKCGGFMKRIRKAVGLPLSTGFPPGLNLASSVPYAPFICRRHGEFGYVVYRKAGYAGCWMMVG